MCNPITSPTTEQLHAEWTEHNRLAYWLCRRKLIRIDGTVPPDLDDRVSDAIAHAWVEFGKIRNRKPDVPAKTAMRWACKTGVSRVHARTRFVPKPYPGYVDAMDSRAEREGYFEDAIPQPEREPYRDPTDRTAVDARLAKLPDELRPLAQILSYGITQSDAMKLLGIGWAKLTEQLNELRIAMG
jgi:hypothetical protein